MRNCPARPLRQPKLETLRHPDVIWADFTKVESEGVHTCGLTPSSVAWHQYATDDDGTITDEQLGELGAWLAQEATTGRSRALEEANRWVVIHFRASEENEQAVCGWVAFKEGNQTI